MDVSIRTTQNVFIEQEKAGVGNRILAFLVDLAIFIAYILAIGEILDLLGRFNSNWLNILFYFPVFFYDLYMEFLNNGQSVGKMALRLKVVRLDGTPPTLGGYLLRWLLRPIDVLLSGAPAIISIGLTPNAQRLGDLAAGTTVIKLRKTGNVSRLQLVEQMDEEYEPVFPQVKLLSDKDAALIKESLQVRRDHANSRPAMLVTEKVKEKLQIESEMPPVEFLYTVLRDHTHYTAR